MLTLGYSRSVYTVNPLRQNARVHAPYHHGNLRAALVATAIRALDREGTLPSLRALARECDVSPAAPYRHFADAAELEVAVIAECFRRFERHMRPMLEAEPDPLERLATAIRGYVRFARRHPRWYALMFSRARTDARSQELKEAGGRAFDLLRDAVKRCGVQDPNEEAYALWAAHHGLADLLGTGFGPDSEAAIERATERIVRMSSQYVREVARTRKRKGRPKAPSFL
jgi:AcrR family transcriptional regulator